MKTKTPIEKVYEAWTAIADERVALTVDGNTMQAKVRSSDGSKIYTVTLGEDGVYRSDDSATYWRGYAGYPVIAAMMLTNRIPFDIVESNRWGGINWTELNRRHKRDYAAAVEEVARERHIDMNTARAAAQKVIDALDAINPTLSRPRKA